jgi:uncharacterized protein
VSDSAGASVTFFTKNPIVCPICEEKFYREEMRTGRGRMIAGKLTEELRRTYEPSKKFGEVFPLIYIVTVCPACLYAAYPADFSELKEPQKERLIEDTPKRTETIGKVFPRLNFNESRTLEEGVASYYLAMSCYDGRSKDISPTFKQGLSSLRAAWLCGDLHRQYPSENYEYLARVFYRKARFFYTLAVEKEQNGHEALSGTAHLGPDQDKNYGYDGVLYLTGYLEYQYGPRTDPQKRRQSLERAKRTVAKIFGMGRASKDKPAAILDNAREVYEKIAHELGLEDSDPEKADAES